MSGAVPAPNGPAAAKAGGRAGAALAHGFVSVLRGHDVRAAGPSATLAPQAPGLGWEWSEGWSNLS